jgi:four helix bundle protein
MKHPTSKFKIQNRFQMQYFKRRENDKIFDLRERLLIFTKRIFQICKMLLKTPECDKIRKQLSGAGSAIGANYEEADGAIIKKDFINKVAIARKEAKETRYWLRVIKGVFIEEIEIRKDIKETEEIINILSSILIKLGVRYRR